MKTTKKILLGSLFLIQTWSLSAQSEQYIHQHLVRSMLTISPGIPFTGDVKNIYLHGNIEYYTDNRISLRGDGYFSIKKNVELRQQHALFSGASFHIPTKNHFDPYIGIGAGLGMIQSRINDLDTGNLPHTVSPPVYDKMRYSPLYSAVAGFNFYAQKYFHFFGELRYVGGQHYPKLGAPVSLNEIRISFGLGWNIL